MNKRGQSIIEYSLIAILVILGIIVMGPYVLRSVTGHYQMWNDGVQDSFKENINQAKFKSIPDVDLGCTCTDSLGEKGSNFAGSQCTPGQYICNHNCNPQGCDGHKFSRCVSDPANCSKESIDI